MKKMLDTPKCGDFVKDLVGRVSTSENPAHSSNPMELFETINSQRGFVYERVVVNGREINTIRGAIRLHEQGNGAQVVLSPINAVALHLEVNRFQTALTAMHEILHLAGANGYSDQAFARAVASMPGATPPTKDISDSFNASEYWNGALKDACFPPNVR